METVARTLAELEEEAARFVGTLAPGGEEATLVTLTGELGAGKTAFAKAVARALGVEEAVTSPTFVLEKIYPLPEGKKFKRLVHIDAYRLEGGRSLAPLAFDERMQDAGTLILLEWPERVEEALPLPAHRLTFVLAPDGSRNISYG